MHICINCGKETDCALCRNCRDTIDIEKLCDALCCYSPERGENELWDRLSEEIYPELLRNAVLGLTSEMEPPKSAYWKIRCVAGDYSFVPKSSRSWLQETANVCLGADVLAASEKNRVKGLLLDSYYKGYQYDEAELIAKELVNADALDEYIIFSLAEFYIQTRRYEVAENILIDAISRFARDKYFDKFTAQLKELEDRRKGKAAGGKSEYVPNPSVNRQEAQQKYLAFLECIGISEVPRQKNKVPKPIVYEDYPKPAELRTAGFQSFVAFDVETTGLNAKTDSIIEFGAIKVVDGKVVETEKFFFKEFVHPYKKKIPGIVTEKTGITNEMVKNSREMWEVFADFADFIGNDILVGFNCVNFDSRFLVRAGRYSNLIIRNKYFDVMRYASELGYGRISLANLGKRLGIRNPESHRALADAITTAKIYLKLLHGKKALAAGLFRLLD